MRLEYKRTLSATLHTTQKKLAAAKSIKLDLTYTINNEDKKNEKLAQKDWLLRAKTNKRGLSVHGHESVAQ